jgi:patatin-like phospholipase/acyl hydrolase
MTTRTILSIDGGGIRGIIPARVLQYVEEVTQARVADLFDFVAGTSTGGILALGLTVPGSAAGTSKFSAADLVQLYEKNGHVIFSRSFWHALETIDHLAGPKFSPDGIESVMREYFGTSRLAEARSSLLVTAYDIERRSPFFFKSYVKQPLDAPMWEIARATSAAPTYFPPARFDIRGDSYALIDGGVIANNPAMCLYVDATLYGAPFDDVLVVSLGTGNLDRRIPADKAAGWGLAAWALPLLDILFDGGADTVDYQLRELLPRVGGTLRYARLQTDLPDANQELDDATPSSIAALKDVADRLVTGSKDLLDEVCGRLAKIRAARASQ